MISFFGDHHECNLYRAAAGNPGGGLPSKHLTIPCPQTNTQSKPQTNTREGQIHKYKSNKTSHSCHCKGRVTLPKRMNFRKSSKRPLTPPSPLIFGKSCCGFFIRLYSLKNHTCGIFLKSPGYESIKNDDPWCQIQCLNFKFWGWLGPKLKRDGGSAI